MELLSPAGSMDCLISAVQNGADAVYFGGGSFNARRYADNFEGDELTRAVDYCHERGVRCYITLNTLLFEREIPSALDFAAELYRIGADAVLVQDLGLASLLRRYLPELTLHASTQMGIHDLGGLQYCKRTGITRAVLAREVGLDMIEYLAKNGGIEIETFAHGALCMSFSGSCLYSSMAGERSGNRGTCAQPCRKRASVSGRPGRHDYCLSPNDICMLSELDKLKKAGVSCVKIEGRMKKPEYVATVTRCYRAALDGADAREIEKMRGELFELFNRGSFSTSHLYGDSVRTDREASSKPGRELVRLAENSVKNENRKTPISFELELAAGSEAKLTAQCKGNTVAVRGAEVQKAQKPQTEQGYIDRLSKLGDTPFALNSCRVDMKDDCYLSAADINAMRREACEKLMDSLHVRNRKPCFAYIKQAFTCREKHPKSVIYARVRTPEQANEAFASGADIVGISPVFFSSEELASFGRIGRDDNKLVLILPNILITNENIASAKAYLESGIFDGAELNNIGQTALMNALKSKAEPIFIAGIGLNALNAETVRELENNGFGYVLPSPELSAPQYAELSASCGSMLLPGVHGRVPVMQLLHCPVKEHGGCRLCKGEAGAVTDEEGRSFPLVNTRFSDHCLVRMLNCKITDLIDIIRKIPEPGGYSLSFIGEKEISISERMNALYDALAGKEVMQLPDSTRGHWNRKVD